MVSIVHVVSSLKLGGAERFVIDLVSVQRAAGIDASIISFGSDDDVLMEEVERNEIPFRLFRASWGRRRIYPPLYRYLSTVDILQVHSPYALQYLVPLLFLRRMPKVIYTRHGEGLIEFRWKILHAVFERLVDITTFVSRSAREIFIKRFGWASGDLRVIENGVCVPPVKKGPTQYPIKFGSVGRMVEVKGQTHLLNAVFRFDARDAECDCPAKTGASFELHFFGSGPLETRLRELTAHSTKSGSIFFHGTMTNRDSMYESIDVLVVSSESEGLSMAILEAMARGIPVIATAVGGNVELVKSGITGFLVTYGCATSMQEALQEFILEPGKVGVLGESARQMVIEKYSIVRTHNAYLQCYRDVSGAFNSLPADITSTDAVASL